MPSVPTDRLGRWGCMVRTAGWRLVAGGSVSPHCSWVVVRTIRGIEKPPFLSFWAGAQDSELPARRPRRATGRAPDWPLVGRHPEPRAAQPAIARASLLLKPSCPHGGRIREHYLFQVSVALNRLLMFPFSITERLWELRENTVPLCHWASTQ